MIRLVQIISDTNIGGGGRSLLNYLACCDRSRFSPSVVLPRGSALTERVRALAVKAYRALGCRGDGSPWTAGIQNPDTDSPDRYLHILELEDMSLVTSGSYQRYYTVDGKPYHHIIDPDTGMPENRYVSVTVLCPDSGMADALSTALFNMEPEAGRQLAERMGAEVLWVRPDGTETATPGLDPYLADQ